jgi:hypothetical protein
MEQTPNGVVIVYDQDAGIRKAVVVIGIVFWHRSLLAMMFIVPFTCQYVITKGVPRLRLKQIHCDFSQLYGLQDLVEGGNLSQKTGIVL